MNDRLRKIAADVFGAGVDPGAVGLQFYLKAQTICVAIAVAIAALVGFAIFYAAFSPLLSALHLATAVFFVAAYVYFRRCQSPIIVTRLCCLCAISVSCVVNWQLGGITSPAIAWFILPAVASALVLGWRDGWFWILVGCICTSIFFFLGNSSARPISTIPAEYSNIVAYMYCLGLASIIGVFFSSWVARQNVLETQLNASLSNSENEAYLTRLLADSATAANGSMGFDQAARVCLGLLCDAQGWSAAHIWRVAEDGSLRSARIWYPSAAAVVDPTSEADALDGKPHGISACIAADTATPILGLDLSKDPRFAERRTDAQCVLAWPVEADGAVDLVLEFFSPSPINLDDGLKTLLRHVAVQLSHVRVREFVQERTEQLAFTDIVTGLPNRAGFEHLFNQKLKDAKRAKTRIALMFVDLNGFKRVNDSLGHATGDRLLRAVGKRLEEHVRPSDLAAKFSESGDAVAARLGGDEFTLVLTDLDSPDGAGVVAQRFLEVLSVPIDVGVQEVNIGASMGIAIYPDDGQNLSDLMRLADAAMYEAKALPGNQFRFATPKLNDAIHRRLWIETELHRAIIKDELKIAFVPIAAANSGRIIANEVVLRWPHREGEIPFKEFLAVAESSGLIAELGYWTIEKTCAAIAEQRWGTRAKVKMCVDISLLQLQQPHFVDKVTVIRERYDCPKGALEFEFSDTGAILKNEECRRNIRRLHEMGIRIVLDRFGTGYSSLIDLRELPVWRVKVSRKFMEAVNVADSNRSMGRAIISMAHSMGIETTVFGVKTTAQAQWLRELGCDALQGAWVGGVTATPHVGADRPSLNRVHALADDVDTPA